MRTNSKIFASSLPKPNSKRTNRKIRLHTDRSRKKAWNNPSGNKPIFKIKKRRKIHKRSKETAKGKNSHRRNSKMYSRRRSHNSSNHAEILPTLQKPKERKSPMQTAQRNSRSSRNMRHMPANSNNTKLIYKLIYESKIRRKPGWSSGQAAGCRPALRGFKSHPRLHGIHPQTFTSFS